jgi:hypothetical protein
LSAHEKKLQTNFAARAKERESFCQSTLGALIFSSIYR